MFHLLLSTFNLTGLAGYAERKSWFSFSRIPRLGSHGQRFVLAVGFFTYQKTGYQRHRP
jgi:hypothetical protein